MVALLLTVPANLTPQTSLYRQHSCCYLRRSISEKLPAGSDQSLMVETKTPYYLYNFLALGAITIISFGHTLGRCMARNVEFRGLGERIVHLDAFSVDPRGAHRGILELYTGSSS